MVICKVWNEFEEYVEEYYQSALEAFMRHVMQCPLCLEKLVSEKDSLALGALQITGNEDELSKLIRQRLQEEVQEDD